MKKEKRVFISADEYIDAFPEETQVKLRELRAVIRATMPGAAEQISYQMPAFSLNGVLVYFAAWKNHIGFYPASMAVFEAFKEELEAYNQTRGSIHFPLNQSLPLNLVESIIKFRLMEIREKLV